MKAVGKLNLGRAGIAKRADISKAMKAYVAFMKQEDAALDSAVTKLVATSSRLYLLGMHLAEQRAFFSKPGSWAKKWRRAGPAPSALKRWLQKPADLEKLESGLTELIMEKVAANKKDAKKNRRPSPSSSDGGGSAASPNESKSVAAPSSNSSAESKKNRAKEKKHAKKKDETVKKVRRRAPRQLLQRPARLRRRPEAKAATPRWTWDQKPLTHRHRPGPLRPHKRGLRQRRLRWDMRSPRA